MSNVLSKISGKTKQIFWDIIGAMSNGNTILVPNEYQQYIEEIVEIFPYLEILIAHTTQPLTPKINKIIGAAAKEGPTIQVLRSYLTYSAEKFKENSSILEAHLNYFSQIDSKEYNTLDLTHLVASFRYLDLLDESISPLPLAVWTQKKELIFNIVEAKSNTQKINFKWFSASFLELESSNGSRILKEFYQLLGKCNNNFLGELEVRSLKKLAHFLNKFEYSPVLYRFFYNFSTLKSWEKIAIKWEETRRQWEISKNNLYEFKDIPPYEFFIENNRNFEAFSSFLKSPSSYKRIKHQKEVLKKLRKFYISQLKFTNISQKIELKYGVNSFDLVDFVQQLKNNYIQKLSKKDIGLILELDEKISLILGKSSFSVCISSLCDKMSEVLAEYIHTQHFYRICIEKYSKELSSENLWKIIRLDQNSMLEDFSNSVYQYWQEATLDYSSIIKYSLADFGQIAEKLPEMELAMMENSAMIALHQWLNSLLNKFSPTFLDIHNTFEDLSDLDKKIAMNIFPIWVANEFSNIKLRRNSIILVENKPSSHPLCQILDKVSNLKNRENLSENKENLDSLLIEIIQKGNSVRHHFLDFFKSIDTIWQKFIVNFFEKNDFFGGKWEIVNKLHLRWANSSSLIIDFIGIDTYSDFSYAQSINCYHKIFISNWFLIRDPKSSLESLERYIRQLLKKIQ